jgi:hypothetical protein
MPSPQERARVRAQLHDLLTNLRSGELIAQAEKAMARARRTRLHWLDRYEAERDEQDEARAALMLA